jgi:hypothetical protein
VLKDEVGGSLSEFANFFDFKFGVKFEVGALDVCFGLLLKSLGFDFDEF